MSCSRPSNPRSGAVGSGVGSHCCRQSAAGIARRGGAGRLPRLAHRTGANACRTSHPRIHQVVVFLILREIQARLGAAKCSKLRCGKQVCTVLDGSSTPSACQRIRQRLDEARVGIRQVAKGVNIQAPCVLADKCHSMKNAGLRPVFCFCKFLIFKFVYLNLWFYPYFDPHFGVRND